METFKKDCEVTGHDFKKVRQLARKLEAIARQINDEGLEIFGAEGTALYIIDPKSANMSGSGEPYVLADIHQPANGGLLQVHLCEDGTHSLSS